MKKIEAIEAVGTELTNELIAQYENKSKIFGRKQPFRLDMTCLHNVKESDKAGIESAVLGILQKSSGFHTLAHSAFVGVGGKILLRFVANVVPIEHLVKVYLLEKSDTASLVRLEETLIKKCHTYYLCHLMADGGIHVYRKKFKRL